MAATTAQIIIGTQPAATVAPMKTWTLLATGPLNVLVKFEKQVPPIEFWQGVTGVPADSKVGFMCDWDDVSLSVALLTGNSLYYRCQNPAGSQFTYSTDA